MAINGYMSSAGDDILMFIFPFLNVVKPYAEIGMHFIEVYTRSSGSSLSSFIDEIHPRYAHVGTA